MLFWFHQYGRHSATSNPYDISFRCFKFETDSARIADESTLLITDIIVEMEDGSLANVEIQKIGYAFPGQRGACYSADLLLRQYKRVKGQKKKKFTYQDMKTVYTIVLFEKSTSEFHDIPTTYIHRARQVFNTGLQMNMLQEYIFIPLDIYRKNKHNKIVENKLDAWLSFISDDSPERILEIVDRYPDFKAMYDEVYQLCRNVEEVMSMFSKELLELDRNTVQYMIEEQPERIDALEKICAEKEAQKMTLLQEQEAQKKVLQQENEAQKMVLQKENEELKQIIADLKENSK